MVLIVFGSDLGACMAVHEYRKLVRREEVLLVADSPRVGYSRSLLPYYAAGLVKSPLVLTEDLLSIADLVRIVPAGSAKLMEGGTIEVEGAAYSNPRALVSLWPALNIPGAINLLTPEDAERLREEIEAGRTFTVVGGCAALPLVDALLQAGVRVRLVWGVDGFDEDFASMILADLAKRGVEVVGGPPQAEAGSVVVGYGCGGAPQLPQLGLTGTRVRVESSGRVIGSKHDVYAIGLATEVVEPEGFTHAVGSEEEAVLQALNFASAAAGMHTPPLRRYMVVRLGDTVYASLGLNQREAEGGRLEHAVTRVKGWGAWKDVVIKALASRDGTLLGVQVAVKAELSAVIGMLYFAVLTRARLSEVSRSIAPIDPSNPTFGDPFSKAFRALLRKVELKPEARLLQRAGSALARTEASHDLQPWVIFDERG